MAPFVLGALERSPAFPPHTSTYTHRHEFSNYGIVNKQFYCRKNRIELVSPARTQSSGLFSDVVSPKYAQLQHYYSFSSIKLTNVCVVAFGN